ncbi:hypothetical protein CHS0354_003345 [Potamilus streckersoni]|uniref:Homeobox domain-containing protein n=1 Tax=Potamilus streckersoni TaxID=2493646 RepID=A0AAE0VQP2_9BIVA|nr:hypothetical protein CHS0354_003345 [Potamilus streckersoni]
MTATMLVQCPRRSKVFTIDSIIGKDSERQEPSSVQTNHKFRERENIHDDRISRKDSERRGVDTAHTSSLECDDKEVIDIGNQELRDVRNPNLRDFRNQELLDVRNQELRDTRDTASLNRASRYFVETITPGESITASPGESIKHFHESFVPNFVPLGSTGLCRHPLSLLNVPGIYSHHMTSVSPVHPMLYNNTRDYRQINPYLPDRCPAYLLPRFGVAGGPGLLFHPYRKPKRIRTAFSPSQLLQLEKAFEKSHYVVGQERKDLAAELQLSETQVKVWFQNRRTKHKRTNTEEESGNSSQGQSRDLDLDASNANDSNEESDISDIDDMYDESDNYTPQYHAEQK